MSIRMSRRVSRQLARLLDPVWGRCGAVDLGDEAARPRQAIRVEADAVSERLELIRRLARMLAAPAADVDAELVLQRHEPALERADDAGGDPRGMPVHAHDRAERLEPERMGEPLQILVAAVMMHDRLGDDSAERGHASAEPRRHPPAMERKISAAGARGHGGQLLFRPVGDDVWRRFFHVASSLCTSSGSMSCGTICKMLKMKLSGERPKRRTLPPWPDAA